MGKNLKIFPTDLRTRVPTFFNIAQDSDHNFG